MDEDEFDDFDDLAEFDEDPVEDVSDMGTVLIDPDDLTEFDEDDEPEPEPAFTRDREVLAVDVIESGDAEPVRSPLMSGHCGNPSKGSHRRCTGHQRANPAKVFQPCPCLCHFPEERYECGACGRQIMAAPHYPPDEDGDTRYVHVDTKRSRALTEEC